MSTTIDPFVRLDRIQRKLVTSQAEADDRLGDWQRGYAAFQVIGGGYLILRREEDVTWGGRRRHWPTSKTITYHATLVSPVGDDVRGITFSRRGHWLARLCNGLGIALVCGVGLPPVRPVERVDDGLEFLG